MAIALDNTDSGALGSGTSQTRSFTTSGSDRLLVVYTVKQGSATCTGVTYAGVAMTRIQTAQVLVANEVNDLWILVNPASGANNIVASFSAAGATSVITVISFTGCSQTGQPDNSAQASATASTTFEMTLTTTADNCWLVGFSRQNTGNQTAGANTTLFESTAGNAYAFVYTPTAQTPSGSKSLNVSASSANWVSNYFSFAPVGAAPATNSNFLLMM